MRRVLMGSVVLFIAACGGDVRSEAKPETQARRAIPTDRESALLVQSLTQAYGSDAVDACLAAWQDERDGHTDNSGPFSKPGAGFRIFLSECVGAPVPADARSQDGEDMRGVDPRSLRSQSGKDMRIQDPRSLRSQAGDMRNPVDSLRAAQLRGTDPR
jgi:hypothetical protein